MAHLAVKTIFAGTLLGALALPAWAVPVNCTEKYTTHDATANGAFADDCANFDPPNDPADQQGNIEGEFGGEWEFVGRHDGNTFNPELGGWDMTITENGNGFNFAYELTVPDEMIGATGDWTLYAFQGGLGTAFLFNDVTFGINGSFNSYQVNPANGDFSHISGFIRDVTPRNGVSEPAVLALFSAGLLAVAAFRNRRRKL